MISITKKKVGRIGANRGVRISIRDNIVRAHFSSEITHCIPKYLEFGIDNDRFYFIKSNSNDGYSVQKVRYCKTVSFTPGGDVLKIIKNFVGNNVVHIDDIGFYVVAGESV